MRRGAWVTVGVVLGAGGTLWSRRQATVLAERARNGEISGDVVRLVERGTQRLRHRMTVAVDAGRVAARRREGELRRVVDPRHAGR